ncbi:unnamed protein product [Ilex paraguariensis]|uniref:Uncharacterized protein n=1 Tax=Ilex paraguariensis TaxID=185542 RepID=A0ABC8RPM3_9AQUA
MEDSEQIMDSCVLSKVFPRSGLDPNNGSQYGAPFNEEECDDIQEICVESFYDRGSLPLPDNQKNSVVTCTIVSGNTYSRSLSEPGPSSDVPSAINVPPYFPVFGKPLAESLLSDGAAHSRSYNRKNYVVMSTFVPAEPAPSSAVPSANHIPPYFPEFDKIHAETLSSNVAAHMLPYSQKNSVVTSTFVPGSTRDWSLSEPGLLLTELSGNNGPPNFPEIDKTRAESLPSDGAAHWRPYNQKNSVVWSTFIPESTCSRSFSEPGPSSVVTTANKTSPDVPDDDDFDSLFAMFTEDSPPIENNNNELDNLQSFWPF